MVVQVILLLALACDSEKEASTVSIFSIEMANYHGLQEGGAWTFRDDMPEEPEADLPDESQLLRVHYLEGGIMKFKRGTRWADANEAGEMTWSVEDGLNLLSWSLPNGMSGSGNYPIANDRPDEEPEVNEGDWSCIAEEVTEHWTWYGIFDSALIIECTDGDLAGTYAFGKGVGLIQLETETYRMDLVAPW